MNTVSIELPRYITMLKIETFADVHIGEKECDVQLLHKRIKEVATDPNYYCILNGDLIDNATRSSIGDVYSNTMKPMEQMKACMGLFEPIKDKIISICGGNHEARTYRMDGIDLTWFIANEFQLCDRVVGEGGVIFIRLGEYATRHNVKKGKKPKQVMYTIYHTHGRGGGRRPGAKANRLEDMERIVDADVYIHSHTHLPLTFKSNYFRTDRSNATVTEVEKLYVNTGAYLNYGGYGQIHEYRPTSRSNPVIFLDGTKREMKALL